MKNIFTFHLLGVAIYGLVISYAAHAHTHLSHQNNLAPHKQNPDIIKTELQLNRRLAPGCSFLDPRGC